MHLNPSETTISVVGLGYVGLPTHLLSIKRVSKYSELTFLKMSSRL